MALTSIRLYIVDAEPTLRAAFARLARSAKMEPVAFASVEEFMAAELADEDACVICNVTPGDGDLELPGWLARAGRRLPVIFLSAHDSEQARATALNNGSAGYFRMPVDDQALFDAIAWALSRQAAGSKHPPDAPPSP